MRPGDVMQRTCPSCKGTHKTIVYQRLTGPEKIDFRELFLRSFIEYPLGGRNKLGADFELYSSLTDAEVLTLIHTIHIANPLCARTGWH